SASTRSSAAPPRGGRTAPGTPPWSCRSPRHSGRRACGSSPRCRTPHGVEVRRAEGVVALRQRAGDPLLKAAPAAELPGEQLGGRPDRVEHYVGVVLLAA